jgi:CBS domain-containing protein
MAMIKIKDRPEFRSKAPVMTFTPETMVKTAVRAMSEKNFGAAVIVDKDYKPTGIITERDFMRRLIDKGLDPAKTTVSQIMTKDLKVGRGDDTILEWVRQMSNDRFRHVPIVDDNGKLINIMSQGDFVSYSWPEMFGLMKDQAVKTVMEQYQLYIIGGAIALYSLAMIAILKFA